MGLNGALSDTERPRNFFVAGTSGKRTCNLFFTFSQIFRPAAAIASTATT